MTLCTQLHRLATEAVYAEVHLYHFQLLPFNNHLAKAGSIHKLSYIRSFTFEWAGYHSVDVEDAANIAKRDEALQALSWLLSRIRPLDLFLRMWNISFSQAHIELLARSLHIDRLNRLTLQHDRLSLSDWQSLLRLSADSVASLHLSGVSEKLEDFGGLACLVWQRLKRLELSFDNWDPNEIPKHSAGVWHVTAIPVLESLVLGGYSREIGDMLLNRCGRSLRSLEVSGSLGCLDSFQTYKPRLHETCPRLQELSLSELAYREKPFLQSLPETLVKLRFEIIDLGYFRSLLEVLSSPSWLPVLQALVVDRWGWHLTEAQSADIVRTCEARGAALICGPFRREIISEPWE